MFTQLPQPTDQLLAFDTASLTYDAAGIHVGAYLWEHTAERAAVSFGLLTIMTADAAAIVTYAQLLRYAPLSPPAFSFRRLRTIARLHEQFVLPGMLPDSVLHRLLASPTELPAHVDGWYTWMP